MTAARKFQWPGSVPQARTFTASGSEHGKIWSRYRTSIWNDSSGSFTQEAPLMKKRILAITATVAVLGLTGTLTPAFTASN